MPVHRKPISLLILTHPSQWICFLSALIVITGIAATSFYTPGVLASDADPADTNADSTDTNLEILYKNGKLSVDAQKISLDKVLKAISKKCDIEIEGLESKLNEIISFSIAKKKPELVIRRLLKHIEENSFAFEFTGARLARVSVMPQSKKNDGTQFLEPRPWNTTRTAQASIVRIQGIVAESQAEGLGLEEGDYVIEYNGEKIAGVQQLIKAVREKDRDELVDMTVIRKDSPLRYTLNGGLIGIRITTVKISKEKYDGYFQ